MLISLGTRALSFSCQVSVRTFFNHLPTFNLSILKLTSVPARKTTLSLCCASAPTAAATSHFQALTPHQKDQIRLYIDSLLQWNQVLLITTPSRRSFSWLGFYKFWVLLFIGSGSFWVVQKMNLTAVKEENEVMERHVEDSLAIIDPVRNSYLSHCGGCFENLSVVDVGSGAGLPGLVLAIACPGNGVCLMNDTF